jgi:phosphoribosyl-ATP pyrophosphohydrolase
MMNFFHRRKTTGSAYEKPSVELTIGADGQTSVSNVSVQISDTELRAKITPHTAKMWVIYKQCADPATAQTPEITKQLEKLKLSIEGAQDDMAHSLYVRSFLNIAEAYETYAVIDTATHEAGTSGWDLAWSVLNHEALETVLAVSRGEQTQLANGYADLLFARGMDCLREMVAMPDTKAQNGYAQETIRMFYTYLLAIRKLGITHWQTNDALKNIHIATAYGAVTDDQLAVIGGKVAAQSGEQPASPLLTAVAAAVQAYAFTETDPARLKQLVY